jgi:hypothetical protein
MKIHDKFQIILLTICILISTESFPQQPGFVPDEVLIKIRNRLSHENHPSLEKILPFVERVSNNPSSESSFGDWLLENYTNQVWNNGNWQNDSSVLFFYNHYALISERITRNWSGSQWVNELRYLFSYDILSRLVEEKLQYYSSGQWVDSLKTLYEYNSIGRVFTETTYLWNNSSWVNWGFTTYTYSDGQLVQDISQTWSGTSWENSGRTTYTYHSDGSTASSALSIWLFGTWINLLQIVLSLNSDGLLDEFKIQYWDFVSGWANLTRLVFTYDDNFRLIEGKWQDWDSNISSWVDYSRITSTYNSLSLLTVDLRELWIEGNWIVDAKYDYFYDSNTNNTKIVYQLWSSGNWINEGRELYTYIPVTSVEEIDLTPVDYLLSQNYPNPFNPSTKISWQSPVGSHQTLKIYDVLGNEVATLIDEYKLAGGYKVEWNATEFPSGVYFYQLKTDGSVETKKMILLR